MSSAHVELNRKLGWSDEALGGAVLNRVQLQGMKTGLGDDEKQCIFHAEFNTTRGPGEIGADRDRKQNTDDLRQHDWEVTT